MPETSHLSGVNLPGLLGLVIILMIVFAPVFFSRRGPAPGQSDEGSDDDGGGGPPRPPAPPGPPPSGIPLDDGKQSRVRLRTHERLADARRMGDRQRSGEPVHKPDRVTSTNRSA